MTVTNLARRLASAVVLCAGAALAALLPGSASAQAAYDAAFVSQTVPAVVAAGVQSNVSITMLNTGTATWIAAQGYVFLATAEPQDNYYWCIQNNPYGSHSGNRVLLPNDVAPGQTVTFNFVIIPLGCRFAAPAPLRFRMLSQNYGTFGQETPDPKVGVSTSANWVSQQVPAVVPAGATIQVTETFTNTSPATWDPADGYALVFAGATSSPWGTSSVPLPAPVAAGASVTFSFFVVTPTTIGNTNFQWQMGINGVGFGQSSPVTAVQVVAAGPVNYGGLWWNSPAGSESGWGINLAHQGDTIFATWFTYDATGKGLWLSSTTSATSTGVYTGTLLQSSGPPFSAMPFAPAQVRSVPVGTATFTFTDANNGSFAYTVNGISQSKTITRQLFGPQFPTCTFNLYNDLTQAYNYQDLWWAKPAGSESGWGANITHQGDVIFLTWFTYDTDGTPMWLFAGMPKTGAGMYAGTLMRTTGPPFNSIPFLPAKVVATNVGNASLTFTDGNNATFAYTIGSVTQTKAITREILVAPGTVCQ
jgi:hypothetical protein